MNDEMAIGKFLLGIDDGAGGRRLLSWPVGYDGVAGGIAVDDFKFDLFEVGEIREG